MREAVDTHKNAGFIHNLPTGKKASEQDFLCLSTDIQGGYYYYLYIQENGPQANPTTFLNLKGEVSKSQLTKTVGAVQDFQLKKKRVKA